LAIPNISDIFDSAGFIFSKIRIGSLAIYFCRLCFNTKSEGKVISIQQNGKKFVTVTLRNEKSLRETQTLRVGCSKAEAKNLPRRRPPSRERGTAKI